MTTQSSPKAKTAASAPQSQVRDEPTNLSFRYGTIGISAVAAAARYSDKKPDDVAANSEIDQRFVESAA